MNDASQVLDGLRGHPGLKQGRAARSILDKGCIFAPGKAGIEKKYVFSYIIKTNSVI